MKTLYRKKAIALYETHMRVGFVVKTVVFYLIAAVLWYIIAVIAPYTATMEVTASQNIVLTRTAFSATEKDINIPIENKERALLMPTGESSFCRRLRLIEDAKSTIDFMVYFASKSEYSDYFYTALVRAADRGVKVRIIQDGKMGKLDGYVADGIANIIYNHNNIELYYFNCINILDPAGLATIMHDKVVIVDGDKMIVGGANMGTSGYLYNYDMEVLITNSGQHGSVGQAQRYYNNMLKSELTERIKSKKRDFSQKSKYEQKYLTFYNKCEFAQKKIDYNALGVPVDKITYLTNPISSTKKTPMILQAMFNMMESSEKSIVITPYSLLENDKIKKLRALAAKNKQFTLITNSLYNSRNVGYADYYYNRDKYINSNIDVYEFQNDIQLHAKVFSFDDRYSVIGSFNLDERSAHIDTESVVIIDSEEFNKGLQDYIEDTFIADSLRVSDNNEYIHSDTVKSHEVSAKKKFTYFLYRALGVVRCLI
ncbi:MAG: hypothetical protein K2O04_01215 [Clostridiales bacterium]|nr:hypothetical protein [Clostridiales bacterium]